MRTHAWAGAGRVLLVMISLAGWPADAAEPSTQVLSDQESAVAEYQAALAQQMARTKRYPLEAVAKGFEGTVLLRMRIDAEGRAGSVTIEQSSGYA